VPDLSPVVAATAQWLLEAYPSTGRAFGAALAEAQARQAVTIAARLRYPTDADTALLLLLGPGGAGRLDAVMSGSDVSDEPWRTWVDEVLASWAACLLGDPVLAGAAVAAVGHMAAEFRLLVAPDERDRAAAALLRHPDLLAPVADLHHDDLRGMLAGAPEPA
jgi:hypothetical protein